MQVHYLAPCPLASSAYLSLYKGYYTKFVLSLVCAGPFLVPRPMASRAYLLLDEGYTQNLYFHYDVVPSIREILGSCLAGSGYIAHPLCTDGHAQMIHFPQGTQPNSTM